MKKMVKEMFVISIFIMLVCSVGLVSATVHNLDVPYHEQEHGNWCGPASAEMLIDYYTSDVNQTTLWNYIQDHNVEEIWSTDPQGLEDCVEHYVEMTYPDYYASDLKSNDPDTRVRSQTWDIAEWGDPSASLTLDGGHWMIVKGANYELEDDHVKEVYGFWVHDPDNPSDNKYLSIDSWKNNYFTQVDIPGSKWDNYWVTVQGSWSDCYSKEVNNIKIMDEEDDSIVVHENTDLAEFALEQMRKFNLFTDALEGAVPEEPIIVNSLHESFPDYYMISFEKEGKISVIAEVFIKDGIADFSGCWAANNRNTLIKPTLYEAKEVLKANGYEGEWEERLVWKPCVQTMSRERPVWEFRNEKKEPVYVGFDPYDNQTKVYNELTPKKLGG